VGRIATATRDRVGVEPRSAVENVSVEPPTAEKLVPFEKLESEYGIPYGRTHCWRLMRAGKFPLSVKLAEGGTSAWLHSELVAWIRSRPRAITVKKS
jgi:predicted DNA-binding transcriptional regulator AlpA